MIRISVVLAAVSLGLLGWVAAVFAHAAYVESTPGESAVVQEAPATVSIMFGNPLVAEKPNKISVKGPDKKDVVDGPIEIGGKDNLTATVPLKSGIPDGRYTVTWKVYALDGMRAEGSYRFYVNVQPTEDELAADRQLRAEEQSQLTSAEHTTGGGANTKVIALAGGIGAAAFVVVAGVGFWLWRIYQDA